MGGGIGGGGEGGGGNGGGGDGGGGEGAGKTVVEIDGVSGIDATGKPMNSPVDEDSETALVSSDTTACAAIIVGVAMEAVTVIDPAAMTRVMSLTPTPLPLAAARVSL